MSGKPSDALVLKTTQQQKEELMFGRIVLYSLIVLIPAMAPLAYAGKTEWSTYYPSPNGEYSSLSATGSLIPPKMTAANRPTATSNPPAAQGMVIFNTTTNLLEVYNGTSWGPAGGIANAAGPLSFNTTSTTWVTVVSMVRSLPAGMVFIFFEKIFYVQGGAGQAQIRLLVDGDQKDIQFAGVNNGNIALSWAGNLSAGNYTITVQCRMDPAKPGHVEAQGHEPQLTVIY